ncbi:hypothetical protein SAMN05443550_105327 [Pedobacter hartonius]|uniref:Uncharacterized protein n=1 Tax=Pedobacter hartonius TaxID=425514 RepID=A0A1H4ECW1_9SPHI|nr:hypothetical protein SAMN05443550_105327 [Pedobacter hartonius]
MVVLYDGLVVLLRSKLMQPEYSTTNFQQQKIPQKTRNQLENKKLIRKQEITVRKQEIHSKNSSAIENNRSIIEMIYYQ